MTTSDPARAIVLEELDYPYRIARLKRYDRFLSVLVGRNSQQDARHDDSIDNHGGFVEEFVYGGRPWGLLQKFVAPRRLRLCLHGDGRDS